MRNTRWQQTMLGELVAEAFGTSVPLALRARGDEPDPDMVEAGADAIQEAR